MTLADAGLYFALTLGLSTLFAMGGVGSAIALVPVLSMLGLPINLAKALGLFVNMASTSTAALIGIRRGLGEVRFALPLVGSVLIATPLGAWASQFVVRAVIEAMLATFLVAAALLMIFSRRPTLARLETAPVLVAIGGSVGVVSGMLGVGGGALMLPALILLGVDAKRAARAISFVIPFSSAGAFATYLSFTPMNWSLLALVAVAAIAGGFVGERIMHHRLEAAQVKKLIALLLLALAGKMLWGLIV